MRRTRCRYTLLPYEWPNHCHEPHPRWKTRDAIPKSDCVMKNNINNLQTYCEALWFWQQILQNQRVNRNAALNHLKPLIINGFSKLSTAKNAVFHLFCSNVKTFAKTHLQATDNKSDNKHAVSWHASRKAVKTGRVYWWNLFQSADTLAERLLRRG